MATNSDPNMDDSMDPCFLLYHCIVAVIIYNKYPVLDCLINWSPTWSKSTKAFRITDLPHGTGVFLGINSFTLPENPVQSLSLKTS